VTSYAEPFNHTEKADYGKTMVLNTLTSQFVVLYFFTFRRLNQETMWAEPVEGVGGKRKRCRISVEESEGNRLLGILRHG
jgi:hypothetical protein